MRSDQEKNLKDVNECIKLYNNKLGDYKRVKTNIV